MLNEISSDHILSVIRAFCKLNDGDDATINIILTIGAEILDISPDKLLEKIEACDSGDRTCKNCEHNTNNILKPPCSNCLPSHKHWKPYKKEIRKDK